MISSRAAVVWPDSIGSGAVDPTPRLATGAGEQCNLPRASYLDAYYHSIVARIEPASTDDLPPMLAPCFEKRHMVDDFVTSDFHPAVRFLVQLHLARGTLTWTDLVKDSAFVLLGQAAQPVIDTLSAINAWCLAQTGDLAADAQDSTFAIDAGFDAASPLASWLTRVRFLAHRKAVAVTRHWFPATATPVSALPTAGVHPLGLSHAAEFRSQPGKPYKDLDCLLHE